MNNELVVAKFFEKPKCKPWDLVKGRRYACCHYPIGKHSPYCLSWGISISMPKFKELTYYDIVQ